MLLVDTAIPGGNGIIEAVEGDSIHLRPDNRDSTCDWFYWHVRIRGCAGRRVRLLFDRDCTMTVRGAVVSTDKGASWTWVRGYEPFARELTYTCGAAEEVRFCLAPPYTLADLNQWLAGHADHPLLREHTLCRSRKGRSVPWLELGPPPGEESAQVVLTARHHCCEMVGSHVLEGLMESRLRGDSAPGQIRYIIIPLVDLDGVEDGDQGKGRFPHDHNRDYGECPLYPEIREIKNLIQRETDCRLKIALDLHCPYVVGDDCNHHIYLVGSEDPANAQRQAHFAEILAASISGPLPFAAGDLLPFGDKWNTSLNYGEGLSASRWMLQASGRRAMTATLEIPYATARGITVTPERARLFGGDLLTAVETACLKWVHGKP